MKYTLEIEIDHTRDRVIELFDSTENLFKWQEGLLSFDHIEGEPGQVGAKSKMRFKMGKREIEMIETVTLRELPERFAGTYEAPGMWNLVDNEFVELPGGRTKYICHNTFKPTSFMMKVMLKLMPGAFKKQTFKFMQMFKDFAESQPATAPDAEERAERAVEKASE